MNSDVSNEVWEIAKDLYDNDEIDCDVNRYGQVEDVSFNMEYDEYNEYYQDCNEADFEKAKEYLKQLLIDTKYYTDYKRYLELSDNHTFWDIEVPEGKQLNYDDDYGFVYDQALRGLSEEIGTDVYGLGRSGRHICVDDTFENLTKLNEFKVAQAKWEKWFIDTIETQLATEDDKMTESLHNGEMTADCLNCGKTIAYTKRDICNDIDGDYIECPSCHATFDVECNNDKCKVSESKEEANTGSVIRESLNTGVLNIIDVDMYSINDGIPESATREGLDEIVQDIAPKYLKEVIQKVLPSVEIYAEGVYHPRQYNFSGDELEFDLVANKEEYEALKERVTSDTNFNAFLRNNYKSHDGLISYMADDISEFKTQDTWKQLVQVIMFALKDKVDLEAVNNEYLDEFLDRVHTEFGWDDEEDDLEESKKEELFDNNINASISTGDISSNIDLGGLGDLLGMTEAKILEAKNNIKYDEVDYNKANKEVNN